MNTTYEQARLIEHRQRKVSRLRARLVRKAERAVRSILTIKGRIRQQNDKLAHCTPIAEPAIADHTTTARLLGLMFIVTLAAVMEYLASGHAADGLVETLAPGLHAGPAAKQIFLTTFVVALLTITLAVKFGTQLQADRLQQKLRALEPDDSRNYRSLRLRLAASGGAKMLYLTALTILYTWLFGFANEYSHMIVKIDSAAEIASDVSAGSPPDNQPSGNHSSASTSSEGAVARLASSPAAFYAAIWILHVILLWLPSGGVLARIALARARRVSRKIDRLGIRLGNQARGLYQLIVASPEEHRAAIFDASRPVRAEIMLAMSPSNETCQSARESIFAA